MRTRIRLIGLLVPLVIGILTVTPPASGAIHLVTQSSNGLFFDVFVDLVDPAHPPDPGKEPTFNLGDSTHPLFSLTVAKQAWFFLGASQRNPGGGSLDLQLTEPEESVESSESVKILISYLKPSVGGNLPDSFFDVTFKIDAGDTSFTWSMIDPVGGVFPKGSLGIEFNPTEDPTFTIGMQFFEPGTTQAAAFHVVPEPSSLVVMGGLFATVGIAAWWRRRRSHKAA